MYLLSRCVLRPLPCRLVIACQASSQSKAENLKRYAAEKVLKERQRLREVPKKLSVRGAVIVRDLQQTRRHIREKMEHIIERENIWTIPNFLCVSRIIAAPFLGYLIVDSSFTNALALLAIAGLTDLADGLIARSFPSQSSKLGSFLDPMADKVLMVTLFLSLTCVGLMPIVLTSVIVVRDTALAAAGFYIRYMSLPEPRTLSRYFDPSHATAQLSPTFISKINTVLQIVAAGTTLAAPVFEFTDHPYLLYLWWATGVSTVVSGLGYVFTKDTYFLMKKTKKRRR